MSPHRFTQSASRILAALRLVALSLALILGGCHDEDPSGNTSLPTIEWTTGAPSTSGNEGLHHGHRVPNALARVPRFSRRQRPPGLRCAPDGDLNEWRKSSAAHWIEATPIPQAKGYNDASDQSAQIALVSYGGGLSIALKVRDDIHLPAKGPSAFGSSDGVEVALWPLGANEPSTSASDKSANDLIGVRLFLGSLNRLVRYDRPKEAWRETATQSFGQAVPGGWHIEARLPLSTLTPLRTPEVTHLRYRVTVYDSDTAGEATPTLRAAGTITLTPPLAVPEAVRRRGSIRICMADRPGDALWSYRNGWRCALPYTPRRQPQDDTAPPPRRRLTYARLPSPPLLRYLRERLLLVNYPGLQRSVAGILDMDKRLVSLLRLGVVGGQDPGNALTRSSDAESLRLPDGTWAVAVTHAYPARASAPATRDGGARAAPPFSARCAQGHRVLLSILALRGAPHCTPQEHVPKPDPPPQLEEVLRVVLDDCATTQTYDWSISRDRKTVKVRDSLAPHRPAQIFTYGADGVYHPAIPSARHGKAPR
ncbi:MAG: hypothetical protein KAI47_21975 [Deltaproteobacteria bacterium]|nr:hypothetical protein [Deltaproteobacteria bacterium]